MSEYRHWREAWADIQNRAFERHRIQGEDGTTLKVDHRSYEKRQIDLTPTQHLGVTAMAMERKGIPTDLGDLNREIEEQNALRLLQPRDARNMHAGALDSILEEDKRRRAAELLKSQEQKKDNKTDSHTPEY